MESAADLACDGVVPPSVVSPVFDRSTHPWSRSELRRAAKKGASSHNVVMCDVTV